MKEFNFAILEGKILNNDKKLRGIKMTNRDKIIGALARGYCTDRNAKKVLDPDLIEDMAKEIESLIPNLQDNQELRKLPEKLHGTQDEDKTYFTEEENKINEIIDYLTTPIKREYSEEKMLRDTIFIRHIQSHLKSGQEVICKICGKTAKEICSTFTKKVE